MRSTPRRLIRYGAPVLLIGLLLAPIVASGHNHAAHPSAQPCATCVATHHAPVVALPLVGVAAVAPLILGLERVVAPRPIVPARRAAASRGPPSSLLVQSA